MGSVSAMESELTKKLGTLCSQTLLQEDYLNLPNPDLAKELMTTFARVRCFAMVVNDFFSPLEIRKINDIALSLTEINRDPKVCVFDNFMTDCKAVDTKDTTSLHTNLRKLWVILDVLLQKTSD
jgi:hypothetical protein